MKEIDYSILPEHMREGMQRYLEHGIEPGDFLCLILCNDFVHAICHADQINIWRIIDYAKFLYLEAPYLCWGSREKVDAWIKDNGIKGKEKLNADKKFDNDLQAATPGENSPGGEKGEADSQGKGRVSD